MDKRMAAWLASLGAALLTGCAAPQPNPEFRACANACIARQDSCMVGASSSAEVARCNAGLDACVAGCEKKFPRYLPR